MIVINKIKKTAGIPTQKPEIDTQKERESMRKYASSNVLANSTTHTKKEDEEANLNEPDTNRALVRNGHSNLIQARIKYVRSSGLVEAHLFAAFTFEMFRLPSMGVLWMPTPL